MTSFPQRSPRPERPPLALHDRAMDNLQFIRDTMERSQPFTAVSGAGGVCMGVIALLAASVAGRTPTTLAWVWLWMVAASVALGVAGVAIRRKARAAGPPLLAGAGRKFTWNVTPPLVVGALVTLALTQAGATHLLPGVWLLLYGTGVVAGGAFSVRVIPFMGLAFMALGAVALFLPPGHENLVMAVGFGGFHIVFGSIIWRKYGG